MESFQETQAFLITHLESRMKKFEFLLWLPHQFIFYRDFYFIGAGSPILEEYNSLFQKLTSGEKEELLCALAGDANQKGLKPSNYKYLINDRSLSNPVRRILGFYAAYGSASGTVPSSIHLHRDLYVPEEKKVEDAGLFDDPDDDIHSLSFDSVTDVPPLFEGMPFRYRAGSIRVPG